MEPSWIFPIPQAMQQHRGSQTQTPKPAEPSDPVQRFDTIAPEVAARAGEATR